MFTQLRRTGGRLRRRLGSQDRLRRATRAVRLTARRAVSRVPVGSPDPLHRAVRDGDLDAVEVRIAAGDDLDAADARGRTPLHVAARLGRADTAASLLAHGADHERRDRRGRRPLDLDNTDIDTLHAVRQHYQRYGSFGSAVADPVAAKHAEDLAARGILRLETLDGGTLAKLRTEFDAIIAEIEAGIPTGDAEFRHYDQESYFWSVERSYTSNNAFKHSPTLARLTCSQRIVDIARAYLGPGFHAQRAVAMRYLPGDVPEQDAFRWHHDLVERRLKIMVLLTDIGPGDQPMSYVVGSHVLFHPYEMFRSNPCTPEYCERHLGPLEIVETQGPAGTVFLFDSNGAHRGTRRESGRLRDALFVELSTARTPQFGGDVPESVLEDGSLEDPSPLDLMRASPKRWEHPITRGSNPTWIVDLPEPSTWVWDPPVARSAVTAGHA